MASSPDLVVQIYVNVGTGFPDEAIFEAPFTPPLCHVPHKNWSTSEEQQNYLFVEQWAQVMHDTSFPCGFQLHVPHKTWATPDEAGNYAAIERWALDVQLHGYREPLHVPHKRWAFDVDQTAPELELDNYRYLENWSLGWAGYPGGPGGFGTPPLYPNLVVQIYENVT